jgi:hypothetical protein
MLALPKHPRQKGWTVENVKVNHRAKTLKGALPGPMGHLGDKADLTPSPLRVSGSHRGSLTGETNDVVRCYGFALTEQASVTLLMPRRNHCSPSCLLSHPGMQTGIPVGIEPFQENGAERNRTAVRNTGVDHLVGPKTDPCSMALPSPPKSSQHRWV